ncbi:hypothetical protein DC345_12575 [Paenibacillus taichungensis]|uniref:Uncharacterized protein n=2 Tax=Paenibacillus TaxID=44249 RepID=A0A329QW37_9BACL|nr:MULTISPECIES: three component ABC system middle component [Paenibacillus]MDO7906076.1 DUF6521 family protein [Paenibacillus sp. JX-17]RAW15522.1 hypothetical protein DC345_12575 [Paenibacillus taichungensis]
MNQSKYFYNNEAFGIVAIASVLKYSKTLPLSKALLILPTVAHKETLNYLKRANSDVKSIEQLIIKKGNLVTNFNSRFQSLLPVSINSINILCEMKYVKFVDEHLSLLDESKFNFSEPSLGGRARAIVQASSKITVLLQKNANDLYLQLRVQL